jgi:hypothetical protein
MTDLYDEWLAYVRNKAIWCAETLRQEYGPDVLGSGMSAGDFVASLERRGVMPVELFHTVQALATYRREERDRSEHVQAQLAPCGDWDGVRWCRPKARR